MESCHRRGEVNALLLAKRADVVREVEVERREGVPDPLEVLWRDKPCANSRIPASLRERFYSLHQVWIILKRDTEETRVGIDVDATLIRSRMEVDSMSICCRFNTDSTAIEVDSMSIRHWFDTNLRSIL